MTQAIQSETKALAAENLELRAENGRLREGLSKSTDALNLDMWTKEQEAAFYNGKKLLSQPTPTGSGERFLRLAAAASLYLSDKGNSAAFRKMTEAKMALTPEDVKILENYNAPKP